VWQDVDIGDLLEHSACFFHYGSTSLADAYLAKVPAVYVHGATERCREWFPDMGWPSTRAIAVDLIPEAVREFRAGRIVHDANNPDIKEVLRFNFNIREGDDYRPSRQVAELLLRDEEAQRVSLLDPHVWRALSRHYYLRLRRAVGRPVKKLLQAARERFQQ
jgi:hypothetical protein